MLTRRSQLILMISTAVAVGGAASVYYPYSKAAQTQRHLTQAHEHVVRLAPMIAGDARFVGVKLGESAREGGVIQVSGTIASAESLRQLRRLIDASGAPVGIVWSVEISGQRAGTRQAM